MKERKEILLIGSNNPALSDLSRQIFKAGAEAVMVADMAQAKARLSSQMASLVVLLIDGIPDPLDPIREFNFLFQGLPILLATEKGAVGEAQQTIAAGAADYLMLPVEDAVVVTLLRRHASSPFDPELGRGRHLITADPSMLRLLNKTRRVARSKANVLVQGESGTGKELIARFVHQVSDRAAGPFIAINCAALPENLLESELFGHAKGAFTGALADRKGKFQQANGGTIFLDEISEMSLNLQSKLLRVLQEKEVDPVGGRGAISLDVRVVASTNRELKDWVAEGHFREDLFYRLNVFPVMLPPLRQRTKDVVLLANHFRKRFIQDLDRNDITFAPDTIAILNSYTWPGNVRELENAIHRALLMAEGDQIGADDLMLEYDGGEAVSAGGGMGETAPAAETEEDRIHLPVGTTVREMEEILIRRTLDEVNGNRTRAAELLGISIRTLRNKLNEYAGR
ncbi:MAG: sigma-54-dependent Fis family transcriptional regulator [Magnetococcales bacterium]|nr:sigma-54-dependent Fis family transcriptional regulator [Magnetococcales bacterium]